MPKPSPQRNQGTIFRSSPSLSAKDHRLLMRSEDRHLSFMTFPLAKASRLLMQVEDRIWERRLGISTRTKGGFDDGEHLGYDTIPYRVIFRILKRLMLRRDDTFLDIGCGRGRVLCCAARYGVSNLIGVDDVAPLAAAAQGNLALLCKPRDCRHEIICSKAENLDYCRVTAIYMYNPFGASTTRKVMEVIGESLIREPRPLRIAYVNPLQESVLADTGWLERYDDWGPDCLPGNKRRVSFWRSIEHP
jgi:hypothetical protein